MAFEIKIPGSEKSYDRAVKKDGEWIGLFLERNSRTFRRNTQRLR